MDIHQLFSYIDNKEKYTKDSLELFKATIEEYPYFQAAHVLLLKSLYINETNNYNSQLKISGTYIFDKAKLFKFLNDGIIAIDSEATKQEYVKKEKIQKLKKELTPEERIKALKEKNINKNKKDGKLPTKENGKVEEKVNFTEKNNAKTRHEGIISDFFQNKIIIKKVNQEKNKIEPIKKEQKETKGKEVEVTAKSLFEANKKRLEQKKQIEKLSKTNLIIKKNKPVVEEGENIKIEEKKIKVKKEIKKTEAIKKLIANTNEIKKPDSLEKVKKIEPAKQKIKEIKKEEKNININKETPKVAASTQKDAMSDIFSKIKAIKKEMNIDSNEFNKKTIDINKNQEEKGKIRTKKPFKTEEKGKIIENDVFNTTTEAIDPFKQKQTNTNQPIDKNKQEQVHEPEVKITEKKNEEDTKVVSKEIEEETIKEEKITAKDLFNKHITNKLQTKEESNENKGIGNLIDKHINKESKKKINEEKAVVIESNEVKKQIPDKKEDKTKKSSAADALLKRIALKKQKMKEQEEQKKLEDVEIKENKVEPIKEDTTKENLKKESVISKKVEEQNIEKTKNKGKNKEFEIDERRKSDILKIKKANNINIEKDNKVEKSTNLIDNFINKSTSLERLGTKETKLKGDISLDSTKENDEIITEAIADLYVQQKHYKKAISAYEKLILKIPEKKTYFAIQIKKVESFINN